MSWFLPPGNSTFAGDIDFLYYMILVITGIAFFIVEGGLVWFIIKYRRRPGRKAYYTHGNMTAEVVWTTIPAVTLVIIGIMSGGVWKDIRGRNSVPPGALELGFVGKQFEWNATYPGADGQLGTGDDFSTRNQLHVPVDQPVVVRLGTEDVIHSFFVPSLRVKQDALPGKTINVWFEAMVPGRFEIACAELCGLGHYRMRAFITVHTADEYARWVQEQTAAAAAGE
jgi:cytochrome c oxidase subunit 2